MVVPGNELLVHVLSRQSDAQRRGWLKGMVHAGALYWKLRVHDGAQQWAEADLQRRT